MPTLDSFSKISASLDAVEEWVEEHRYKGYEPFDGLTSVLFPLTFGNRPAAQVLQQVVRRFPVNIRPMLGIRPLDSTKGQGYMAWGYLLRYRLLGLDVYRAKALSCLDWTDQNKSPLFAEHSWGNHFLYASRGGIISRYEPTIVWTGLIGQAFLDAFELFGLPRHKEVIRSIADWMLDLPRYKFPEGVCLSYTMQRLPRQGSVHNSNMIGAAFLARAARVLGDDRLVEMARQAVDYSCAHQRPEGSWFYGEDPMFRWIDAFHTGYVLDSLKRYQDASGDFSFSRNLSRGLEFFKRNFFLASGQVKYYAHKASPIDIQCGSQAIDTLAFFSEIDPDCARIALRAAFWHIDHMQDADGHFYFRRFPLGFVNKAPMIHWGQATMHRALSHVLWTGRASAAAGLEP